MDKKICVITSTRADYGLLKPVLLKIKEDFDLQLIVTGMHLSEKYGLTVNEIKKDGFKIDAQIHMDLENDQPKAITKAMSQELSNFSDVYDLLKPDLLMTLGDRYEILIAVTAATIFNIPIAHLCGGDITEGAYDNSIRDAISKLSHLHFVTNKFSKRRLIQMGENPQYVFNFGNPGLQTMENFKATSKIELGELLKMNFNLHNFVILIHPVTLEGDDERLIDELLKALDFFNDKDHNFIFILPNCDNNNNIISTKIIDYSKRNSNTYFFKSLIRQFFLSLISHAEIFIGNSSAGIYEVPFLHKPTINIGNRQKNRLRPCSVLNCNPSSEDIVEKIKIALKVNCLNSKQVYKIKKTADLILQQLHKLCFKGLLLKEFHLCECKKKI